MTSMEFIQKLKALISEYEGSPVIPPVPPVVPPVTPPVVPPVVTPTGAYTSTDTAPHLIPYSSWLIPDLHGAPYLQGRMWWLLEEMAKAADMKLTVLQGCPLDTAFAGSPAHWPCNQSGGGLMADVGYPSVNGKLDLVKMKILADKFLEITLPPLPAGQEWRDIARESEIRVGSDVFTLSTYHGNRHVQIDDSQHHRFDDALFPHFHLKWHVY